MKDIEVLYNTSEYRKIKSNIKTKSITFLIWTVIFIASLLLMWSTLDSNGKKIISNLWGTLFGFLVIANLSYIIYNIVAKVRLESSFKTMHFVVGEVIEIEQEWYKKNCMIKVLINDEYKKYECYIYDNNSYYSNIGTGHLIEVGIDLSTNKCLLIEEFVEKEIL